MTTVGLGHVLGRGRTIGGAGQGGRVRRGSGLGSVEGRPTQRHQEHHDPTGQQQE
jgi:hypothetical protein